MKAAKQCAADGCDRPAFARELCSRHYVPVTKRSASAWYCPTCSIGHMAGTSPCPKCCGFAPDGAS